MRATPGAAVNRGVWDTSPCSHAANEPLRASHLPRACGGSRLVGWGTGTPAFRVPGQPQRCTPGTQKRGRPEWVVSSLPVGLQIRLLFCSGLPHGYNPHRHESSGNAPAKGIAAAIAAKKETVHVVDPPSRAQATIWGTHSLAPLRVPAGATLR
jgi:hypothetical protein